MNVVLRRKEWFCASHRLFNPQLSDAENLTIYGKCAHINGHGHNYALEVCVVGPIDPRTAMVFNLQELKDIIQNLILNDVDHKHLNHDVPWLAGLIPTTEVLAQAIWDRLQNHFQTQASSVSLHQITVWETHKNSVSIQAQAG